MRNGHKSKLKQWRYTLAFRGFRLRRSKTKYLKSGFIGEEAGREHVTLGGVAVPRAENFKYLA